MSPNKSEEDPALETESLAEEPNISNSETLPVADAAGSAGQSSLLCMECGSTFAFAPQEQEEYRKRGYQPPKRCPSCRQERRRKGSGRGRKSAGGGKAPQSKPYRQEREPASGSFQRQRERGNYGNDRGGSRAPAPDTSGGSYVEQAENMRREPGDEEVQPDNYNFLDEKGYTGSLTWSENKNPRRLQPGNEPPATENPADAEEEKENYGNSIYYQGPGVNPNVSARDEDTQYAPWEGAHGMLLTHHEQKMKNNRDPQRSSQNPGRNRGPERDQNRKVSKGKPRPPKARKASFDIVCHECGKATQVPFKPLPDRPVYCRDCYSQARLKGKKPVAVQETGNAEVDLVPPTDTEGESSS